MGYESCVKSMMTSIIIIMLYELSSPHFIAVYRKKPFVHATCTVHIMYVLHVKTTSLVFPDFVRNMNEDINKLALCSLAVPCLLLSKNFRGYENIKFNLLKLRR